MGENRFKINSDNELSSMARDKGIFSSDELFDYIKSLPYGRNENRTDLSLVFINEKGTCSSKHALVKSIASENGFEELELCLGMFKMNHINTPNIGDELIKNNLKYIPEAHCYLKYKKERIDLTSSNADFSKIEENIVEELVIIPEQIGSFKVNYHQKYIKNWIIDEQIPYGFDKLWKIREHCILNLTL